MVTKDSKEMAKIAVSALEEKKAKDLKLLDISDVSVLADYFVLVTGDSSTQVKALADEIEYKLGEAGEEPAGPYRMNCDEAYPT